MFQHSSDCEVNPDFLEGIIKFCVCVREYVWEKKVMSELLMDIILEQPLN